MNREVMRDCVPAAVSILFGFLTTIFFFFSIDTLGPPGLFTTSLTNLSLGAGVLGLLLFLIFKALAVTTSPVGGIFFHFLSQWLSPQLRKLLVRPVEVDEFEETKKLLRETINLTKAAMWKGLITMDSMAATFKETLEENALYRPYMINKNLNLSELLKGLNLND